MAKMMLSICELFHEYKVHCCNDAEEGGKVVPMQYFALKHHVGNDGKYKQGDALLQDLELNEGERTTIARESDTIGRNLTAIFKEGDEPREDDNADQWPV